MTEGRKDDAGKPRPTLVFGTMAQALAAVVEVAEYGAKKYAPDNWLLVPDGLQRYSDALLRHALAALRGEVLDPESGLRHTAHMAWCALAVLELRLREAEGLKLREVEAPKRGRGPQPSVQHVIDELSKLPAVRELQEAGLIEFKWQHGDVDSLTAHVGKQVFPLTTAYSKPAFERWAESLRPSRKLQADATETLTKLVNPGSLAARAVDAGLMRARYRWSSKQPAVYVELLRGGGVLASTKAKVTGDGVPMAVSQAFEAFCNLPSIHTIVESLLRRDTKP